MNYEKVAGAGLVLGVVIAGTVLALWSDWDAGGIIGFLSGLLGVGVALLAQLRATQQVHVLVNRKSDEEKEYRVKLVTALQDAGIRVPEDGSVK